MAAPGHGVEFAVEREGLERVRDVVAQVVVVALDERVSFGQQAAVGEVVQVAGRGPDDVGDRLGGVLGLDRPVLRLAGVGDVLGLDAGLMKSATL